MPISAPPPNLRPVFMTVHEATIADAYKNLEREMEHRRVQSAYLTQLYSFEDALRRLAEVRFLKPGWDTYDAEPPNAHAINEGERVIGFLREENLPPTRLLPSAEGGIGISFVQGDNRAELEIFNTGEVIAATYTSHSEPTVWEIGSDQSLKSAITRFRVHLAN